jgi:hypothetical protein
VAKTKGAAAGTATTEAPEARFRRLLKGKKLVKTGRFDWTTGAQLDTLIELHGGRVVKEVSPDVSTLVVPDITRAAAAQKKAESLNKKGATIQVIDGDDLVKMLKPSDEQIVAAMKSGGAACKAALDWVRTRDSGRSGTFKISGEDVRGVVLDQFEAYEISFANCDFAGAQLVKSHFEELQGCTFTKANLRNATIDRHRLPRVAAGQD